MKIDDFIKQLAQNPESISFEDTMSCIEQNYAFTATAFQNGNTHNPVGENSGSCKIFAFAKLHHITQQETLHCFGNYYRNDVVKHPLNTDHQNIRNFIEHGWPGISFEGSALQIKASEANPEKYD